MSELSYADVAALYVEELGWPLFPASPATKRPLIKTGRDHAEHASRDVSQVREWFTVDFQGAAIATACGAANGMVVIDADAKHDGERVLAVLETRYGALPRNYVVRTQSGGIHVYCRHPGGGLRIKSCVGGDSTPWPERGVDVRADGGIALLPPSPGYVWEVSDGEFNPLPAAWVVALQAPKRHDRESVNIGVIAYDEPADAAALAESRSSLISLRAKYRRSERAGDDARAELLDRVLEGRALGAFGERDSAVTRAGYIIGCTLPNIGPDNAERLAAHSLVLIPTAHGDSEDLAHWREKFTTSYEAGARARREQHERERLMWQRIARRSAARS